MVRNLSYAKTEKQHHKNISRKLEQYYIPIYLTKSNSMWLWFEDSKATKSIWTKMSEFIFENTRNVENIV